VTYDYVFELIDTISINLGFDYIAVVGYKDLESYYRRAYL